MGMLLYVIIALLIFAVGFAIVVWTFRESDDKDVPVDLHEHYSKPSKTKQQKPKYSGYDEVEDMPSLMASDLCEAISSKAESLDYTKQRNTDELYEHGKTALVPKMLGAINRMVTENANPVNTVWVEISNDFNLSDDDKGLSSFKVFMEGGVDCRELRTLTFPYRLNKNLLELGKYNKMYIPDEWVNLFIYTPTSQPTGEFNDDGHEIYRSRLFRVEELDEGGRDMVLSVPPNLKAMIDGLHERGFDVKRNVYGYYSGGYKFEISWCNNVEDTNE